MLIPLLFLILAFPGPLAIAQNEDSVLDPHPLRPAYTSSPRETLRTFLTNTEDMIVDWRQDDFSTRADRVYLRAVDTLDLSTTPHSDSWLVQTQRMLLLREILDRIELPPDGEIPSDQEVADGAITRWTLPDTGITIARIEDGPRAGEFLFSAETVQQLGRFFRTARHLPYQQGATTAGIYEEWLNAPAAPHRAEQEIRRRLKPVDTSNPRSTFLGFLESVSRAYALVMEADAALAATPPTLTKEQALENETKAWFLLRRATTTLDLSRVPEALRQSVGIEAVLQLKEIMDRMELPNLDRIPDAPMVEAARERASQLSPGTAAPLSWKYPNTQIEIQEITEGEGQGEFLFSAETVRRLSEFYTTIQDLPYRRGNPGVEIGLYQFGQKSEGFYHRYASGPNYLIPGAHFVGGLFDHLPAWSLTSYQGQALWKWIGLVLIALGVVMVAYGAFWLFRHYASRPGVVKDYWLSVLNPIIIAALVLAAADFVNHALNMTGAVQVAVTTGRTAIVFVMMAWAVYAFCKAVAETIIASPRIADQSLDASLLRVGTGFVGFLIGAWIIIDGARDLGADMIPLLAGFGIGGLAVALAAQKTIANFFGSLILFANRPVRVGDFCRYGDQIGTVEQIGLHSTRIRSLERTVVNVPNAEFSEMQLDNFARRDQRLLKAVLRLRYETTLEQLRYILARLRELLLGHPMVSPDPARVRFIGYGEYSLDLEIFAYLRCQDQNTFLAIQEDILLRMGDIVKEAGTNFAFSSQRAHLGRDTSLDAERREEAEAQVGHWRGSGRLPFPEFDEEEREQLKDRLDYPPEGSPDYQSRERVSSMPLRGKSRPAAGSTGKRRWFKKD